MEEKNIVREKSYALALRIVKLSRFLVEKKREYVLSKQILKSGTSVAANVEEAIGAHSKKDFYAKMGIAYREARETRLWLWLLRDAQYITLKQAGSLLEDCEEILKILGKIQSTIRKQRSK